MITFIITIAVIICIAILLNRYLDKPKQPLQEMVSDSLNCPKCKTPINLENNFCPKCGFNLAIQSPMTKTSLPNKSFGMKPSLITIGAILIIILTIWLSRNDWKLNNSPTSSYKAPDNKTPRVNDIVTKNGRVGKYTYYYSKTDGYIAVVFDGKGIDVDAGNLGLGQIYQDKMILLAIIQTVNSISGFKDININDLKNYTVENRTIILKGINCYYKVAFLIDGNYITGMFYNDCN